MRDKAAPIWPPPRMINRGGGLNSCRKQSSFSPLCSCTACGPLVTAAASARAAVSSCSAAWGSRLLHASCPSTATSLSPLRASPPSASSTVRRSAVLLAARAVCNSVKAPKAIPHSSCRRHVAGGTELPAHPTRPLKKANHSVPPSRPRPTAALLCVQSLFAARFSAFLT